MVFRKIAIVLLGVGISFSYSVAWAHHSFSMFDQDRMIEVTGTVKDYEWTQPHVWLDVMVTNKQGKVERWGMENQSPAILFARGWRTDSIRPGDKITVQLRPMKDHSLGGAVMSVTLPGGKQLTSAFADRKVVQ